MIRIKEDLKQQKRSNPKYELNLNDPQSQRRIKDYISKEHERHARLAVRFRNFETGSMIEQVNQSYKGFTHSTKKLSTLLQDGEEMFD